MAQSNAAGTCAACGRELPSKQGRGRHRQYCDATCRSAARRERERADEASAASVNDMLTPDRRHGSLHVMADSEPDADYGAQPVTPAGGGSPLAGIAAARRSAAAANAALQQAVDQARAAGHSWREIGDVLDTTRQAAFQRFGRPIDPRTGAPMSRTVLPGAAERAIAIFADMAAARWEQARLDFDETMRSKLDAERLAAGWAQTVGMIGSFERMGEALARSLGDNTVAYVPLYFEAGERIGQVSFGPDGQVAGLFIRPAPTRGRPLPPEEREQGA